MMKIAMRMLVVTLVLSTVGFAQNISFSGPGMPPGLPPVASAFSGPGMPPGLPPVASAFSGPGMPPGLPPVAAA